MAGSPRIIARPTAAAPLKDKPSAVLKKRRPRLPLRATATQTRDPDEAHAATVEQKRKDNKNCGRFP
jgi:hypothetical protein